MSDDWKQEIEQTPDIDASELASIEREVTDAVDFGPIVTDATDGGFIAKSVHGPIDDRKMIADTTTFPASAVAQLIITAKNGKMGAGTGAFITDRVLLTAAHNVFVPGNGPAAGLVQSILVVPGRNGSAAPFGAARSTSFYVPEMWMRHTLPDFDYALIFVPALPGVGRYQPVVVPDDQLLNLAVQISGYPVDKPVGTQWFDSRVIAGFSNGQVAYDIDTVKGQSGALAVHFQDGRALAVAIHRFENTRANFGTRITQSIFDDIQSRV